MPRGIRPTQDKVRKAIFDTVQDLEGVSFLELFAGSGSVGFEAASRGADPVVMVEQNRESLKVLMDNMAALKFKECQLIPWDAEKALERLYKEKRTFNVVFFDPPYYLDLPKKTLQLLVAYDIVAPDGLVIIQHHRKDLLPDTLGVLRLLRNAKYGETRLTYYRKQEKESNVPEGDIPGDV